MVFAQDFPGVNEVRGIEIGSIVPNFEAQDQNGHNFNLDSALKDGPVVLIFYRGFWCPYCNKHLEILQDSLSLIETYGGRVIGVSPEKPEYLQKMSEKSGTEFSLLYDEGYRIADKFDVNFLPGKSQLFTYNTFLGAKLKASHSDESQRLPIPASFIIGEGREIVWRQFDTDYKKRAHVQEILTALKSL